MQVQWSAAEQQPDETEAVFKVIYLNPDWALECVSAADIVLPRQPTGRAAPSKQ